MDELVWWNINFDHLVLTATIGTSVFLFVFFYFNIFRKLSNSDRHKLPPGPQPWPIIGNIPSIGLFPHLDFARLAKHYGPIFLVHLGSVKALVVSSPQLAEEILKTQDHVFASRPCVMQTKILAYDNQGVSTSPYGSYWRSVRKVFTLELLSARRLQEFQAIRNEEVFSTLHSILEECKGGEAVRMDLKFENLSKNHITRMMINESFFGPKASKSNLDKTDTYGQTINEFRRLCGVFVAGDFIPLLRQFDPRGYKKQMISVRRQNDEFLGKIIEDHRKRLRSSHQSSESAVTDIVDVLITSTSGVDEKPLTDDQIKAILLDVVVAGTDTSKTVLEWAMTELLRHPAVLKRAQEELDTVVGRERLVQESDIPRLTYLHSTVKETLRLHPIFPLLLPHMSTVPCEVGGYYIPVKSLVLVNTWAMGRDPAIWERALEFHPDRFLTNTIDMMGQNFELLPFGSGRRICPGRNLGLLFVQYTLAVLLQTCDWTLPGKMKPEDIDVGEAPGLTIPKAIPLETVAIPRLPLTLIYADQNVSIY